MALALGLSEPSVHSHITGYSAQVREQEWLCYRFGHPRQDPSMKVLPWLPWLEAELVGTP